MRPTRVELQGFSAFREHTVLDLDGVDLFALTGATGAGKSSLIDAMIFALYGCIPRLDKKSIEPLVSLGVAEARVRLDFTVQGIGYTAVRVVRRRPSGTGATTREARLERADGEVLAGNEKELSAAVGELLGLGVDEFTTCVVLPQGAFAHFLHEPGKDRQDLLVKLLDLGLYDRMARVARQRERDAEGRAEVAETLLGRLAHATPEAVVAAEHRVAELDRLQGELDAARPAIDALRGAEASAQAEAERAAADAVRLESVRLPDGVRSLRDALDAAVEATTRADALEEAAAGVLDAAESHLSAQPGLADLRSIIDAHRAVAAHREQLVKADGLVDERRAAETAAGADLDAADHAAAAATAALEAAQWEHRARDLAATLVAGEHCPVCRQVVTDLPTGAGGSSGLDPIAGARQAKRSAEQAQQQAIAALRAAERERIEVVTKHANITAQLEALSPVIRASPDLAEVEARMVEVERAAAAEKAARTESGAARKLAMAARKDLVEVQGREAAARRRFEQTRGELITFEPPASTDALADDWTGLVTWAVAEGEVQRGRANRARATAIAAVRDREAAEQQVLDRCRAAGLEVAGSDRGPGPVVADARARTGSRLDELRRAAAEAEQHRAEAAEQRTAGQVAHQLALHLSANHFEKWVLDEVLASLVARATDLLVDLSAGAYSLALDDKSNFAVIDHRNADQVRSARTLSGGETFLASLALALALADQIGELATRGSARLESIFLDEGFGTLDPDTLDTVATAIEELGSRHRMVGLVSHVPELAERVPVRFEVERRPGGSTVARVDR